MVRKTGPDKVEFLDNKGFYLKMQYFSNKVESCMVNGDTVAVSMSNGKTELFDAKNGSYIRTV